MLVDCSPGKDRSVIGAERAERVRRTGFGLEADVASDAPPLAARDPEVLCEERANTQQ